MQAAVIATADLSDVRAYGYGVRPSVRLSITFPCFVQTNEDTIVRSSSLSTIILVSGEVKFIRIFAAGALK